MNKTVGNSGKNTKKSLNSKQVVEIKAVTWNKDSHGLFDYENSFYDMRKFQIMNSVIIFRSNSEIEQVQKNDPNISQLTNNSEFLLSINQQTNEKNNRYFIDIPGDFPERRIAPNPTYLIVRSLKQKDGRNQRGYTLKPGNVMKLGRMEYRVI